MRQSLDLYKACLSLYWFELKRGHRWSAKRPRYFWWRDDIHQWVLLCWNLLIQNWLSTSAYCLRHDILSAFNNSWASSSWRLHKHLGWCTTLENSTGFQSGLGPTAFSEFLKPKFLTWCCVTPYREINYNMPLKTVQCLVAKRGHGQCHSKYTLEVHLDCVREILQWLHSP